MSVQEKGAVTSRPAPPCSRRSTRTVAPSPTIALTHPPMPARGGEVWPLQGQAATSELRGLSLRPAGAGLRRFALPVLRRGGRDQLIEKPSGCGRNRIDGSLEGFLVRPRRLREAAHLANVLERGGPYLSSRSRRLEVVERMDASAHGVSLCRPDDSDDVTLGIVEEPDLDALRHGFGAHHSRPA